ncbi:hypothetical protein ACFQ1I_32400 [Kitasatospora arboriphila]
MRCWALAAAVGTDGFHGSGPSPDVRPGVPARRHRAAARRLPGLPAAAGLVPAADGPAADQWAAAQQQPYQAGADQQAWQQGADQQAWQQQTAAWDPQTAQAYQQQGYDQQAYQQQAGQQGYDQQAGQQQAYEQQAGQQGYYAGGYEQIPQQQTGDPYQANAGYTDPYAAYGASSTGTADAYAQITPEPSLYAPADQAQDSWQTQQQEMPTVGFPDTSGRGTAFPADPDGSPEAGSGGTLSPYVVTRDDRYSDDRDDTDGNGRAAAARSPTAPGPPRPPSSPRTTDPAAAPC